MLEGERLVETLAIKGERASLPKSLMREKYLKLREQGLGQFVISRY